MACKDSNGNLISAESAETMGEYNQERIPEEKVISWMTHIVSSSLMQVNDIEKNTNI